MKIFIMRHGEAEHFAASDSERQLTPAGVANSIKVAKECAGNGFNHFDCVLVSPYVRAQQTWDAIAENFTTQAVYDSDDITPYGQSDDVYEYLCAMAESKGIQSILLVSHLPLVGYLTAEFAQGITPPMFPTSGMTCVEFDLESRSGELLWKIKA